MAGHALELCGVLEKRFCHWRHTTTLIVMVVSATL